MCVRDKPSVNGPVCKIFLPISEKKSIAVIGCALQFWEVFCQWLCPLLGDPLGQILLHARMVYFWSRHEGKPVKFPAPWNVRNLTMQVDLNIGPT